MTDKDAQMPELLPCPFCGDPSIYSMHTEGTILHPHFYLECGHCGARTGGSDRGDHYDQWNTRADKAIPPEVIAQVAAALDRIDCASIRLDDNEYRLDHDTFQQGREALALLQPYVREGM